MDKSQIRYVSLGICMFNNAPHQKRAPYCDFLEVIRFLKLFQKGPRNAYQIYRPAQTSAQRRPTDTYDTA